MAPTHKPEELYRRASSTPTFASASLGFWERLTGGKKGRDDDDDDHDLPGPNAGATLWPVPMSRKTAAFA